MTAFSSWLKADNDFLQAATSILGAWWSHSLPGETDIQDATNPMFCRDPSSKQLFPVPHLLGLRKHRNSYPRNGITGDENQELRRCMRFHTIKTYWYLPVANINIFIYTSVCPWQVTVFENINFPITASTHSPLHSHSCPYCFQINHYVLLIVQASLPLNIPLDCQNACNWKTFLPD